MRWKTMAVVGLAAALAFGRAAADERGRGSSGWTADAAPVTKDTRALGRANVPIPTPSVDLRRGFFGGTGAAQDANGPSRLGPVTERHAGRSYGEATPPSGYMEQGWRSGDRVRSASSADVRAARGQQAPDLEWARSEGGQAPPAAERPYGYQFQREQEQRGR